ncbi:MAG: hypothetical protein QXL15_00940 [Candidatus Korarchaeota archaeon]
MPMAKSRMDMGNVASATRFLSACSQLSMWGALPLPSLNDPQI